MSTDVRAASSFITGSGLTHDHLHGNLVQHLGIIKSQAHGNYTPLLHGSTQIPHQAL